MIDECLTCAVASVMLAMMVGWPSLLKIVYLLMRLVLSLAVLAVLLFRRDLAKDAELLVVRHEALLVRMEVEDLRLLAVAAVG